MNSVLAAERIRSYRKAFDLLIPVLNEIEHAIKKSLEGTTVDFVISRDRLARFLETDAFILPQNIFDELDALCILMRDIATAKE